MATRVLPTRRRGDYCLEVVYDPDGDAVDLSSRVEAMRPIKQEKDILYRQYRTSDTELEFVDIDGFFLQSSTSSFLVDASGDPEWFQKPFLVRALDRDSNEVFRYRGFVLSVGSVRGRATMRIGNRFQTLAQRRFLANDGGQIIAVSGEKGTVASPPGAGNAYLSDITPRPAFGCGVETWEFTFSSPTAFTVRGSVTGADGSGTTAADFTSDSGRIRVLAADWVGTFAADDQCSIVTAWRASSTRVVDLFEEVLTNAQAGNLGATELDDSIDDLKGSAVDQPITGYVVDGSSTTILDAIDNVALHMLAVGIEKLDARVGLYAYIPRIESQVSGILCKSDDLMDARIREHTAIYNVFRAVHDYDEAEQRFDGATHFPEEDALNPSLLKYGRREAPREAELRAFGSGNQDWIDSLLEQNYARWSEPREIVTALLKSARLGVEIDELFEIDSEQPTFELFGEPAAISRSVVPRPRMEVDLFEVGFYVQPDDSCGFMFHDSGHRHDDCWTHF